MDLFEYQGKQYFARFGIPVSAGGVATTVDEAVTQAEKAGYPVVVKAQVQVGGRGKAGGIKLAADADEVRTHAGNILGMDIKGHVVRRVWVEHASDITREFYASFTLDRGAKLHLGMLSAQGGVDIEQVAAESPEAIARIHIDPVDGLSEDACREWVDAADLDPAAREGTVDICAVDLGLRGVSADELIAQIRRIDPTAVLTLGDDQYPVGAYKDFRSSYDRTWGAFKAKTYPAPGNHDCYTISDK